VSDQSSSTQAPFDGPPPPKPKYGPRRPPPGRTRDQLPLTGQQRTFATAYAQCREPVPAYRRAYPAATMAPSVCRREAEKMLRDARVAEVVRVVSEAMAARGEMPGPLPPLPSIDMPARLVSEVETQAAVPLSADQVPAIGIDDRGERYLITRSRIAQELALLGFARMSDFVRVDAAGLVTVDLKGAQPEQWAAIERLEVATTTGKDGITKQTISIKLTGKRTALMDLARLAGWIDGRGIDDQALGKDGGEDAEERRKLRQELLRKLDALAKPAVLDEDEFAGATGEGER
jgi:hypothetical protein